MKKAVSIIIMLYACVMLTAFPLYYNSVSIIDAKSSFFIVLSIITAVLLFVFLLLARVDIRLKTHGNKWTLISTIVFVATLFLSSLFSGDYYNSLFDYGDLHSFGSIYLLIWIMSAFFVCNYFTAECDIQLCITFSSLVEYCIILCAIFFDYVPLDSLGTTLNQIGTIGTRKDTAEFCVLTLAIMLSLFSMFRKRMWLYGIVSFAGMCALLGCADNSNMLRFKL